MNGYEDAFNDSVDFTKLPYRNLVKNKWFEVIEQPGDTKEKEPDIEKRSAVVLSDEATKSLVRTFQSDGSASSWPNLPGVPLPPPRSKQLKQRKIANAGEDGLNEVRTLQSSCVHGDTKTLVDPTELARPPQISKLEPHGAKKHATAQLNSSDPVNALGEQKQKPPSEPFPNPSAISEVKEEIDYSSAIIQALSLLDESTQFPGSHHHSLTSTAPPKRDPGHSTTGMNRGEVLYEYGMRTKIARQHWATMEKTRQEILEAARTRRDCTFVPKLSPYAARIRRPPALRPDLRIESELLHRKQLIEQKRRQTIENELEECTFRPLTLSLARLQKGLNEANSDIFSSLYQDAKERLYCQEVVTPYIVGQLDRRAMYGKHAEQPLTEEEVNAVVERLCVKNVKPNAADPATTFAPALSRKSNKIIQQKLFNGERSPDVVDELTRCQEVKYLKRLLQEEVHAEQQKKHLPVAAMCAAYRRELETQRIRTFLVAKFELLAQYACKLTNTTYHLGQCYSVVNLAKSALDLLSPSETDELISVFEQSGLKKVNQKQFVELVLRSVSSGADSKGSDGLLSALLKEPPPCGPREQPRRHKPELLTGQVSQRSAPSNTPRHRQSVVYQKPDPAVLERARAKREARMEQWRQEARARSEERKGNSEPPPLMHPLRQRLMPYECHTDAHVEVRTNRAMQLRLARLSARAPSVEDKQTGIELQKKIRSSSVPCISPSLSPPSPARTNSRISSIDFPHAGSHRDNCKDPVQHLTPASAFTSSGCLEEDPASRNPSSGASFDNKVHVQRSSLQKKTKAVDRTPQDTAKFPKIAELTCQKLSKDSTSSNSVSREKKERGTETKKASYSYSKHTPRILYKDLITQNILVGSEKSLRELGRQLLVKQLEDFRKRPAH